VNETYKFTVRFTNDDPSSFLGKVEATKLLFWALYVGCKRANYTFSIVEDENV